jgi:hypothetical protein
MKIEELQSLIPEIKAEIIEEYRQSDVNVKITSIYIATINERFFVIFTLRFPRESGLMFMHHKAGGTVNFEKREMDFIESATSFSCVRELALKM